MPRSRPRSPATAGWKRSRPRAPSTKRSRRTGLRRGAWSAPTSLPKLAKIAGEEGGTMARKIDPRRRCLPLKEWPEPDQQAWEAAMRAVRGRFSRRGAAARLAPATIGLAIEGYGRWLGFLRYCGWLDPAVAPLARLTE